MAQYIEHRVCPTYYFTANTSEARDFLATGAACGICVAFRAPLAGCLFVVEEAGSFFTTRHLEYTFFACVLSYFVALLMADPEDGFIKFKQTTGFFCDSDFGDGTDVAMFLLLAIVGGILGSAFNQVVEHLNHLRAHHTAGSAWKRSLEVLVLVLVTGSVAVFLPAAFPCEVESRELLMKDSTGCLSDADLHQISFGEVQHDQLQSLLNGLNSSEIRAASEP